MNRKSPNELSIPFLTVRSLLPYPFYHFQKYAAEVPRIFQEVQSCYDYGNTLLADELLNQTEKDRVQLDAEEIGNKLRTLQNDVEMKQKRLVTMV